MKYLNSYSNYHCEDGPLLTIMLPTTVDRRPVFKKLLSEIKRQIAQLENENKVEVIIDEDRKEKSIGKKRQDLLERSKGRYVVGIDSDDWIATDYIKCIIDALESKPGVHHVGFIQDCDLDGWSAKAAFSVKYKKWEENKDGYNYVRTPCHITVIRRDKAIETGFDDVRFAEDRIFGEKIVPKLKTEVFIPKDLYFYRYKSTDHNKRYGIK